MTALPKTLPTTQRPAITAAALNEYPEPTSFEMLLGRNLRVMRILHGYTLETIADKLGCHRSHLCNLERGRVAMSLRILYNYCGLLSVTPADVLPTMAEAAAIGQREWARVAAERGVRQEEGQRDGE